MRTEHIKLLNASLACTPVLALRGTLTMYSSQTQLHRCFTVNQDCLSTLSASLPSVPHATERLLTPEWVCVRRAWWSVLKTPSFVRGHGTLGYKVSDACHTSLLR